MKNRPNRMLSLLLCLCLILPFAGCSQGTENASADTETAAPSGADPAEPAAAEEEEEYVDHRFDGYDYEGRAFRIQSSADATDATNANEFIEGSGSLNGEIVNDAVFERNAEVEELLNVHIGHIDKRLLTIILRQPQFRRQYLFCMACCRDHFRLDFIAA